MEQEATRHRRRRRHGPPMRRHPIVLCTHHELWLCGQDEPQAGDDDEGHDEHGNGEAQAAADWLVKHEKELLQRRELALVALRLQMV